MRLARLFVALALVSLTAAGRAEDAVKVGDRVGKVKFTDIRYLPRTLDDFGEKKALVLVFTNTSCPLAQRYLPVMQALSQDYTAKGVQFVAVCDVDRARRQETAASFGPNAQIAQFNDFRELLARESNLPKWRELLIAFRRLEDRGEVRGGRFVSGFIGEQFALPEAVESLRAMRNVAPSGEVITLSAADPLNLVGVIVPGERVPAIYGKYVSFRDGVAVKAEERISVMAGAAMN